MMAWLVQVYHMKKADDINNGKRSIIRPSLIPYTALILFNEQPYYTYGEKVLFH